MHKVGKLLDPSRSITALFGRTQRIPALTRPPNTCMGLAVSTHTLLAGLRRLLLAAPQHALSCCSLLLHRVQLRFQPARSAVHQQPQYKQVPTQPHLLWKPAAWCSYLGGRCKLFLSCLKALEVHKSKFHNAMITPSWLGNKTPTTDSPSIAEFGLWANFHSI